jgi:hypothetical protein
MHRIIVFYTYAFFIGFSMKGGLKQDKSNSPYLNYFYLSGGLVWEDLIFLKIYC